VSERAKMSSRSRRCNARARQQAIKFPSAWGGARKGAGPKPRAKRPGVSHRTRDALASRVPAQVTMRVESGFPSLRRLKEFAVLRGAMVAGCEREGFRLVHFSVQSNHLNLLVEGDCRSSLSGGLQGLAVRMARALNRLWRRMGSVFADRGVERAALRPLQRAQARSLDLALAPRSDVLRALVRRLERDPGRT
jgi:REP-associated tyrosine transposase